MKKNYISAVKFYSESNNAQQLNIAYVEIERFMETYSNFKANWNLDLTNKLPDSIVQSLRY